MYDSIKKIILFYVVLCSFAIVWSESNGIWHNAEDIRGGIFGLDEQDNTGGYSFINPVTFNYDLIMNNNKDCDKLYTSSIGEVLCGIDNVDDADSNIGNEYPLAGFGIVISSDRTVNVDASIFATQDWVDSNDDVASIPAQYCPENEYVYGIDSDGNLICKEIEDTSPLPEAPSNVGLATKSFNTGYTVDGTRLKEGCYDVNIDCTAGSSCTVSWDKIGSQSYTYYGVPIETNLGNVNIVSGDVVQSPIVTSTYTMMITTTTDFSCVVKWDESDNKIKVYGLQEEVNWFPGEYSTYQYNAVTNGVNWYTI